MCKCVSQAGIPPPDTKSAYITAEKAPCGGNGSCTLPAGHVVQWLAQNSSRGLVVNAIIFLQPLPRPNGVTMPLGEKEGGLIGVGTALVGATTYFYRKKQTLPFKVHLLLAMAAVSWHSQRIMHQFRHSCTQMACAWQSMPHQTSECTRRIRLKTPCF